MATTAYKYDSHGMYYTTGITQKIKGVEYPPVNSIAVAPALKDGYYYMINENKDGWIEKKVPETCEEMIGITIKHQDLSPYANLMRERMNSLTQGSSEYRVTAQGEGENEIRFVEKIPKPTFEEQKTQKAQELASKAASFEQNLNKDMYFVSSLGFKVNGDRRTRSNIEDLITYFDVQATGEPKSVAYRDYDNVERLVTKEQLQIMLAELVECGNSLYQQKWSMEAELEAITTQEELDNFEIVFVMKDYTAEPSTYAA
ncbi:DUF4376 domain-containing protein [Succinatimonas hippei]|uniref:DUF4376 domain-containing protein n=1 Tax=Succinatimonas hippei TaxID=626938 RepID=UPI00248FC2B0|nr:DUF4376 domain-containing protein [Succinatimonas hippei]